MVRTLHSVVPSSLPKLLFLLLLRWALSVGRLLSLVQIVLELLCIFSTLAHGYILLR